MTYPNAAAKGTGGGKGADDKAWKPKGGGKGKGDQAQVDFKGNLTGKFQFTGWCWKCKQDQTCYRAVK